jgi:crotonobetainyl-CoA:carnitine CoA-transferase CaiB-like acyl-CoA transferase
MEEISQDPQVKERGSISNVLDPVTEKTLAFPANPILSSKGSPRVNFPGLPMGAANEFVLENLLGYAPEEVLQMKREGVI